MAIESTASTKTSKTSAASALEKGRIDLHAQFSSGESKDDFSNAYVELTDHYFRQTHQNSTTGRRLFMKRIPFALLAVGGYGRRELNFHSDIDILILFGSKIPKQAKELVETYFYPLWDLGFELGYGVRTIKDCLALSRNDFEVLTSIMDARFICGDSPLFLSLMESLQKKIASRKAVTFARWLEERHSIRMESFGDASHLLEPDLKDGIGGLRDYHQILWSAKALFGIRVSRDLEYHGKLSHREYAELRESLQLVWNVRNRLHQLAGRKNDRLNFEFQEDIAHWLGFQDQGRFLAVEQFMGELHAAMANIKSANRMFVSTHCANRRQNKAVSVDGKLPAGLALHGDGIQFDSATAIISNPSLLITLFDQSALHHQPITLEAERLVREFLYLMNEDFRMSPNTVRCFFNILNADGAFDTVEKMFDLGVLEAFIPEFESIRNRVQFDAYHIFPVDRHSLETLGNLKNVGRDKDFLLVDILNDLPNVEPLLLAGLLHDIGKTEKNHAQAGARIVKRILKRLGCSEEKTDQVAFLILHHLLLVETATRRDLEDEKVIVQCARTIGNIDNLKMLYLLAWADARATGPRAWNSWTQNLVQELFFKILNILLAEELATPDASHRVEDTLASLHEAFSHINKDDREALFSAMTPRYLLNCTPREIIHHVEMLEAVKNSEKDDQGTTFALDMLENEMENCVNITFISRDRPGIFSDMAGVLAINQVNIMAANIYTWGDGTAVDIFKTTPHPDPYRAREIAEKVQKDLEAVFRGELPLSERIHEKSKPSILNTGHQISRPARIQVDNRASDFFTLIEVFADDCIGLLYRITRALFELQLDIRIAKIATKGDQVADVFYVRDLEGQKVEDPVRLAAISKKLEKEI